MRDQRLVKISLDVSLQGFFLSKMEENALSKVKVIYLRVKMSVEKINLSKNILVRNQGLAAS